MILKERYNEINIKLLKYSNKTRSNNDNRIRKYRKKLRDLGEITKNFPDFLLKKDSKHCSDFL